MDMKIWLLGLAMWLGFGASTWAAPASSGIKPVNIKWTSRNEQGGVNVHLYMYWSHNCPHCHVAMDFLKDVSKSYPWIKIHLREVSKNKKNLSSYFQMADALGEEGGAVPAFFYCGYMYSGYTGDDTTGKWLVDELKACRVNPV